MTTPEVLTMHIFRRGHTLPSRPTRTQSRSRLGSSLVAVVVGFGLFACDGFEDVAPDTTNAPPLYKPSFPTGLAVNPAGDELFVVSSNFSLKYASGALLVVDLGVVDDGLLNAEDDGSALVLNAIADAAYIPSFGHRPVFAPSSPTVLIPTRDDNRLVEVTTVDDKSTRIACGERFGDETPSCTLPPFVAELAGSDPYAAIIYEDTPALIAGVVGLITTPEVFFFTVRRDRGGADRIKVAPLTLGPDVIGVRGLAYRNVDNVKTVFATVDRLGASATRGQGSIAYFDPTRANPLGNDTTAVVVRMFDLFELAGTSSARDIALTPDGDALIAILRSPDGLLRVDVEASGSTVTLTGGGIAPVCREPTSLAATKITGVRQGSVDRVLVTCFSSDAVVAFDPVTLTQTDALRFFGRGPFDVAVRNVVDLPPRAYVSFFREDTIGVFDLVDEQGDARLRAVGKIGVPTPEPEDGR